MSLALKLLQKADVPEYRPCFPKHEVPDIWGETWDCQHCGREKRHLRRFKCQCGQLAPAKVVRRALEARRAPGPMQGQQQPARPGWQKDNGGSYLQAAKRRPERKPKAPAQRPAPDKVPDTLLAEMPAAMADTVREWQVSRLQLAALPKPPANNVEAERRANRARRALEHATKKREDAEKAVEQANAALQAATDEVGDKTKKVEEAEKDLRELCASKLKREEVLAPTQACLQNAVFLQKWNELQDLF